MSGEGSRSIVDVREVDGECGRFWRGGGGMENLREDDIDRDVSERINDSLP